MIEESKESDYVVKIEDEVLTEGEDETQPAPHPLCVDYPQICFTMAQFHLKEVERNMIIGATLANMHSTNAPRVSEAPSI
uniref:Uncharacterized protein n=1 Tax=Romanomermis culicivorax TaxID=13658 RepID=A0A915KYN9_ROMCU